MTECIAMRDIRNSKTGGLERVPCGECPNCKARHIAGWSVRLMHEFNHCISARFLTMTYDSNHLRRSPKGRGTLRKRDLQLFFKRLRRKHDRRYPNNPRIKYFAVGEYGEKKWRPHYHVILFNASVKLIQDCWREESARGKEGAYLGEIHFGEVNEASIGYCFKYCMKGKRVPYYKGDDRVREWSVCSKGIGLSYLTEGKIKWHLQDLENRMYVTTTSLTKVGMPRYYKLKIYSEEQRAIARDACLIRMAENKAKEIAKYGERYFTIKRKGLHALCEKHKFNLKKLEKLDL